MSGTTCADCGLVPEALVQPAALLLQTPERASESAIDRWSKAHGLDCQAHGAGGLLIRGQAQALGALVEGCCDRLTRSEVESLRGRLLSAGEVEESLLQSRALVPMDRLQAMLEHRWLMQLLAAGRLYAEFQPLVSLETGQAVGFEALARGEGREGRPVPPYRLFEAAAAMGCGHLLDRIARRQAVAQGAGVIGDDQKLSINFMPNAIYDPATCLRDTRAACDEFDVPMDRLIFEVVESEKVRDIDHLQAVMREYRQMGAAVALDDFGSGYASVNLLARLKPDYVKIDRELVTDAFEDHVRGTVLKALVTAARELGITVVAEGIETADDLAFCCDAGAHLGQGYFFGRPHRQPQIEPDAHRVLKQLCPAS